MGETKSKVVILGAGFGGVYTLLNLLNSKCSHEFDITLISNTNYFLFTPMLHEVATGGLGPHHIVEPIRKIFNSTNFHFCQAEVKEVNLKTQYVNTSDCEIPYDYLVISLGSEANYFGVEGAKEYTYSLKTLEDAIRLKNQLIDVFEKATRIKNVEERKKLLTFVVVGAGPTGVELVAEMSELFHDTFSKLYREIDFREVEIVLINSGPNVLLKFPGFISIRAQRVLEKKSVTLKNNVTVNKVDNEHVYFGNEAISSSTVVWTAGVKPFALSFTEEFKDSVNGRINVNEYLQLKQFSNAFVLGDLARKLDLNGNEVPMLAQAATRQATVVAQNLCALKMDSKLIKYHFKEKGLLVSLGRWNAAGKIGSINISGFMAWWLWRTVYLTKFLSWPKRIKIALDWTLNFFSPRDISKL